MSSKLQNIANALEAARARFWAIGLDRDGTSISNHMAITNLTKEPVSFVNYYINYGRARVLPDAGLLVQQEDNALFHAIGGWGVSGSSGILTYQLDKNTYLHILWDCPYNFNHHCNFIGLYLCGDANKKPSNDLFNRMEQYVKDESMQPKQNSNFDLVCCGPADTSVSYNGKKAWGFKRPCRATEGTFRVDMTMGDTHKTFSAVTIQKVLVHII